MNVSNFTLANYGTKKILNKKLAASSKRSSKNDVTQFCEIFETPIVTLFSTKALVLPSQNPYPVYLRL